MEGSNLYSAPPAPLPAGGGVARLIPAGATATELLPLVYEELRRVARLQMSQERDDQTLQPTALVHEAYLRIARSQAGRRWDNPSHFFVAAAEAMRRILVERARRRHSAKHGGGVRGDVPGGQRVELESLSAETYDDAEQILALDDALAKLAVRYPEKARLVDLRYFAGLTTSQAAEVMQLSCSTADRYWAFAKAWLYREMAP